MSNASSRLATTDGHCSPGSATRTNLSSSTPASAAAALPSSGDPTSAHQPWCWETSASNASTRDDEPLTVMVEPRRTPPSGKSSANACGTGKSSLLPAAAKLLEEVWQDKGLE